MRRRQLSAAEYREALNAFAPPAADEPLPELTFVEETWAAKRSALYGVPMRLPRALCPPGYRPTWKPPAIRGKWCALLKVEWLRDRLSDPQSIDAAAAHSIVERLTRDAEQGCPLSFAVLRLLRPAMADEFVAERISANVLQPLPRSRTRVVQSSNASMDIPP